MTARPTYQTNYHLNIVVFDSYHRFQTQPVVVDELNYQIVYITFYIWYNRYTKIFGGDEMSTNIGLNIKFFREKAGITQSHLAEILNVSPQAVSKWETSTAYPDIMLLPVIADYFNVSCDALLTDHGKGEHEWINELLRDAGNSNLLSHDGYFARIHALEEALERYPRSYNIMLQLAYMYSSGTMYPEYEEYEWHKKIIDYCERVHAHSEILHEKYDAITLLCYMYNGVNNKRIVELAEQMPELHQSKPALIYHGYEGNRKYEGMYEYYLKLLDSAQAILSVLIGSNAEMNTLFDQIRKYSENRELWAEYQNQLHDTD